MKKELDMVMEFHKKFQVGINEQPTLIESERSDLRHSLMQEEVKEYFEGVEKGDLPNIAKELADILYSVYGTILEHGLQAKIEDIFAEVHRSNMSKDYHPRKVKKGEGYKDAKVDQFFI